MTAEELAVALGAAARQTEQARVQETVGLESIIPSDGKTGENGMVAVAFLDFMGMPKLIA